MMKVTLKLFALLFLLGIFTFASCQIPEIPQSNIPGDTVESTPAADITVSPPPKPFTVTFEENETFLTEAKRKASLRIDSSIRKAIELLNTIGDESILISDCDYETRPQKRDSLKDSRSKEIYDHILAKVSAYEDYSFYTKDYPGEDLFNLFVNAIDALRIDHTELFLYSDGDIGSSKEYVSCYFMPGDRLNKPCDDRDAIRAEVDYCNAVIDRILEKMPTGLSNYEKCCYFAFVLAAANEYDHSEDVYLYDYQAYSAFVKGKALCSGYAQAFYRLCREEGISCWYCRGTTPEGGHAWNMLDTEDGVVYVDVTWYDTENIAEDYRDGRDQYLFMTQEDFDYYGYVQELCQ